jgi:hypothetical protein
LRILINLNSDSGECEHLKSNAFMTVLFLL